MPNKVKKSVIKVEIIESEAGWGQRVDSTMEFPTLAKAKEYVTEYNSHNTEKTVPSWYMYAQIISVDGERYYG